MLISNFSVSILAYIFFVYVLCGVIKGSIGFGMPTISISLLSFVIDIKIIIALILIPTLIVNIYQLSRGGNFIKIINETKFFLIFSTIFIYPGAYLLKILDSFYIIFFIAIILISNSALYLLKINIKLPYHDKSITQIIVGSFNGVVIGMTSIYTMPLVFLLQSLNYNKNKIFRYCFFYIPWALIFANRFAF